MPGLTDYGKELCCNLLFRNAATPPPTLYLGLATASIDDSAALEAIAEESDANYARQIITFTEPAKNNFDKYSVKNDTIIEFPVYAAPASVPVTHAFVTDNVGIIATIKLDVSKEPITGEKLSVPIGFIEILFEAVV